jgi:hypothetical protein
MGLAFSGRVVTSDGTMPTTHPRCGALVRQAFLSALTTLVVNVAHAQSNLPSPGPTPCDTSLSDRFAPDCKGDVAFAEPDASTGADADGPAARGHDDLADRPKQIETMNQQLRIEKRKKDSLLHLYADEAMHDAARLHALEEADKPIRAAEARIEDLTRERRRLAEATGLYAGKRLPSDLRNQMQSVDTALQQATATLKNCRDERALVGKNYDDEVIVLRKLWAAQQKDSSVVAQRGI